MTEAQIKFSVQRRIVFVSLILLIGKFIAFAITNSVGILTDAMESIVNVTAGFISLYSIYISNKPKDDCHPFGHGKIELISASIEALMILVAGALIMFEGIKRLFESAIIQKLDVGIYIIAGAGLVNWILGWYSIRIGKRYDSIALIAGGKHLHSDVYSTIGLVTGLIILYVTKIPWVDSALAIVFGSIILFTGIGILRKTVANLMDKADPKILKLIYDDITHNRQADWVDVHNMKVLKSGNNYFLDCDITLPWYYNIRQGHNCCVKLGDVIQTRFPDKMRISIHSDPCQPKKDCSRCSLYNCTYREYPLEIRSDLSFDEMIKDDDLHAK